MNPKIVIVVIGVIVVLSVVIIGLSMVEGKVEEPWDSDDISASWGTDIQITYKDGTSELLSETSTLLYIGYNDKEVSSIEYLLSVKIDSDEYSTIDMDLLEFVVSATITDKTGEWGTLVGYDSVPTIDTDGFWHEIYNIEVDADGLEVLDIGYSYNLSFTPSGTIYYRSSSESQWESVSLPTLIDITFTVGEDTISGDKYIEVDLKSGGA